VGSSGVASVRAWTTKVRPPFTPKTFTISWTEKSDMSSWWTYSDDAAWLTAGSTAFDDFFWYSAVLLDTSWNETAEMVQSWWVFTWPMSTLWNITSWDNVMIKFPVRWIKMSKSWSIITLSITKELNREGEWYQYYAHCTWTLSEPWTPKDAFYIWAYEWYNNSNVLKSWSWRTPNWSITQANFCTYAKANNSNLWWNIYNFYQRQYINALYIMKYGNPNSQSVIWQWYTNASSAATTWWTDNQTAATYWTSSATQQCRLFWLEDRWGNMREFLWWTYVNSGRTLYTQLSWYSGTTSWWQSTWATLYNNSSNYCLATIAWSNNAMFSPLATVNNTSYNTYYCDFWYVTGTRLVTGWWHYSDSTTAWVLCIVFNMTASWSNWSVWARLMYI
jgi:hypothetical protein